MTEPIPFVPYAPALPASRDADHLRVLSICHYVWGGLVLLFSSFGIIYVVMGVMMAHGQFNFPPPPGRPAPPPMPANVGYMFAGFGGCFVVVGWTLGILAIVSGRHMAQRRSRVFSIVIASIGCLSIPLGTTLGVFTIVVLMRDSVKALYAATPPPPLTLGD